MKMERAAAAMRCAGRGQEMGRAVVIGGGVVLESCQNALRGAAASAAM
jgi:hypothetical protein